MNRLNKLWRLIATGFCFSVFGIGGLLLALLWLPLYKLRFKHDEEKRKKACRYAVHLSFKVFIKLMGGVGVVQVDATEVERLQNLRGKVIVANHPSLIDVVVLISLIPNADCIVKKELWKNVFIRGVIKSTGYISNADPEGLFEDCQRSLESGNNLIIFPEGTRTTPNTLPVLHRGAANIALRCKKDMQLVNIRLTPPALTKGYPWYRVPPKKINLQLQAKSEIRTSTFESDSITKSVRNLTRELEKIFIRETQERELTY